MTKTDRWHSNLPRPSKKDTPIYYAIYNQYVNRQVAINKGDDEA